MVRKTIENPLDINDLFQKTPAITRFSSYAPIPTQLKEIMKANPDYVLRYAQDENGKDIKVSPKPKEVDELLRSMGMDVQLRGVGFTRKNKKQSKRNRKISAASRKRNRQ